MSDRNNQRNKRREEADCQKPVSLPAKVSPPKKGAKKCDPALEDPAADQFFEPVSCPPKAAPQLIVPDPLVIGNDEVTVECPLVPSKPGDVGAPVTIAADTFTDFFNFGSIEDINTNQLTAIAGLSSTQRAALADPSTPITTIAAITHLNTAQATFINDQVIALKAEVNDIALTAAEGQISCLFFNDPQSVTCDDAGFPADAYTNSTVPSGEEANVNNPSAVSGDVYSSPNSQEEADDIAASVAQASLKCYYGNDEVTVSCLDIGFGEAVPVDTLPALSSDDRLRVGTVTIAADTIFSNAGRDDATALATTLAESQLVCFYLNTEVNLTCASQGKTGTAAPAADVAAGQSGNPVVVPAGFVQSTVSTIDANARALILAENLLECYWVNTEQCKECPAVEVTNPDDPDGPPFYVVAQEPGPLCVAAGEVRSYVSQIDANEQAQLLAEVQLLCIYCNPEIYPKCAPETWSGTVPVPPEEVDGTWAVSATRGAAPNTICSTNAQDVTNLAVSVGNVSAKQTTVDDCCYGNLEVSAVCGTDGEGNPPDTSISSDEVVIAANTIIVCDSDATSAGWVGTTQAYATDLAQKLADAALICVWSNTVRTVACPVDGAVGETNGPSLLVSSPTSVEIPAGSFISFTSLAEANTIADTVGQARLSCVYGNRGDEGNGSGAYGGAGEANCSPGTTYLGQPTMTAGSFSSSLNSDAASATAEAMSDAMAVCADNDLLGSPGNDGPQTDCNGDCHAYYS